MNGQIDPVTMALIGAGQVPSQGMAGTPGGPVQESPTMGLERFLQMTPHLGSLGATAYGTGTFNPAVAGGGALGALMTQGMYENAQEPNIRDVWADQLRMKMQGN